MAEELYQRLWRLAQAAGLPEVELGASYGKPALKVAGKAFSGYREADAIPFRLSAERKEFLLAAAPDIYFETDHYKGSIWLLVRPSAISDAELTERIVEAWLLRAPKSLVSTFEAGQGAG
jgi:hypothetical protein